MKVVEIILNDIFTVEQTIFSLRFVIQIVEQTLESPKSWSTHTNNVFAIDYR